MIAAILFASDHWSVLDTDTGEQLGYGHGHNALLKWLVKHNIGAHEVENYMGVPMDQFERFEKFIKEDQS